MTMKISAISDLHGNLPEIEPCDLLLISGDICPHAPAEEVERFGAKMIVRPRVGSRDDMFHQMKWLIGPFKEWLDAIPAREVVACWGNHDFIGEKGRDMVPSNLRWKMLTDEQHIFEGKKIWGTPWQPWFYDWAFNAPDRGGSKDGETFLARKWALIPDDTDILIVHGPPVGYGDTTLEGDRTGSTSLLERIKEIGPQIVVCGHIHEGYGRWELVTGNRQPTMILNASVLDRAYEMVNRPFLLEV